MNKTLAVRIVIVACSLFLAAGIAADEAVELKPKLQTGKRYIKRLESVQKQTTMMDVLPVPIKQDTTQTHEIATSVLRQLPDGDRELEMEFLTIKLKASTIMGTISFDSTKDIGSSPGNPFADQMRNLVGTKIRFVVGPDNQVKGAHIIKTNKAKATEAVGKESLVKNIFNEEAMKEICSESLTQGLPKKPVKPGDTWDVTQEIHTDAMGVLVSTLKYTFKGWEERDGHRCALIHYIGPLSVKPVEGRAEDDGGEEITFKEGAIAGKLWFDPVLGATRESAGIHTMKMDTKVDDPFGGPPKNATIDQTQNLSSRLVEIQDIKPR